MMHKFVRGVYSVEAMHQGKMSRQVFEGYAPPSQTHAAVAEQSW